MGVAAGLANHSLYTKLVKQSVRVPSPSTAVSLETPVFIVQSVLCYHTVVVFFVVLWR